jgi:hypothetical protein
VGAACFLPGQQARRGAVRRAVAHGQAKRKEAKGDLSHEIAFIPVHPFFIFLVE